MTFRLQDVLALITSPDNVGDNWRVVRPFTRLRQAGIDARWAWEDHAPVPTDPERTVLVLRLMTGPTEAAIDQYLSERRPKVRSIVFETDDISWGPAVADHLEAANFMQGRTREQILHEGEMARYLASQCDGAIVSSPALAEIVQRDAGIPTVWVPNAIDARWFRCQMAYRPGWQEDGRVTIGWCGGRRPDADVEPMAVAWGRIAKRYPHVRFVVAGSLIPDPIFREVEDDSRLIRLPWVSWEDCPVLYQVDIGCVAVADTPFSRAKTPIKLWEYTVGGAAVIGTPTLYDDCLRAGGYFAETADDWEVALAYLIERPDVRQLVQRSLLDHVEMEHTLDGQLWRWPAAFEQIVNGRVRVAA